MPSVVDLLDVEVDRELPGTRCSTAASRGASSSELDRALAVVAEREETFFQHGEVGGRAAVGPTATSSAGRSTSWSSASRAGCR